MNSVKFDLVQLIWNRGSTSFVLILITFDFLWNLIRYFDHLYIKLCINKNIKTNTTGRS